MEVSIEDEVNQLKMGKPHVVILGAGASYAALPNGDKNGKKLPLMNNFIETLGLEKLVEQSGLNIASTNFEDIYSDMHKYPELTVLREQLESEIYKYFRAMELPDEPTIYDHLVLSLRKKDIIATFNWDPFLVQAIRRNGKQFDLPKILFLHGNVEVAYCPDKHMMGNNGDICHYCDKPLIPTKLLYPVKEKNYHKNEFISNQWIMLDDALKHAFMVTLFGYGAPASDASAIELLKQAWGNADTKKMEEIEIIDIRDENDLIETWKPFIYSHHYRISNNFYDSWISNHPRRTGEAYINQNFDAMFIADNPLPKDVNFDELWLWFGKLKKVENKFT